MPLPIKNWSNRPTTWATWFKETAEHQVRWHGDPPRELRWKLVVAASGATFIFGWIGFQLLTSNFNTADLPSALIPNRGLGTNLSTSSPTPSNSASSFLVPIVKATAYDPFGNEEENNGAVSAAIDDDPTSVWTTVTYNAQDMDKAGVGLILDLGTSQQISEVAVNFEAAGQDFSVYISDEAKPDPKTAEKLGSITKSESVATIKSPRPVTGKYVLIWLTSLSAINDGYASGIANVQVLL